MSSAQIDPQMLQALLGGQGGGGMMPQGPPQDAPDQGGDWLTNLINETHQAMVSEGDPETVSVLGKIIDLLTTVQAKKAAAGGRS